jgi:hypothetical protein
MPSSRRQHQRQKGSPPPRRTPTHRLTKYYYVCVVPASRDRERANNLSAESRLVDPSQTPQGNLEGFTQGGYVDAYGGSLTPYGGYTFYWWLPTGSGHRTGEMEVVQADARGNVYDQNAGFISCLPGATNPAVLVVDDLSSGIVTTAGTTYAIDC